MIKFDDTATLMNNLLTTGGFLSSGDKIMTISWGMVGVIWRKKIFLGHRAKQNLYRVRAV